MSLTLCLLLAPLAGWGVPIGRDFARPANGTQQGNEWKYLTGGTLRAVKMAGNDGWAVGDRGLILHTSDGGTNWSIQESGTNQILRDVDFSSSRHGWAVGDNGAAIKTDNGGATWQVLPQIRPWVVVFYRVSTVDSMHAWFTNDTDTILRTTDGGESFEAYQGAAVPFYLGIDFVDSLTGYACGAYGWFISKTTDGGRTWTSQLDNRYGTGNDLDMLDSLKGWAAISGGTLLHTEDGWNTWIAQNANSTALLGGISFSDSLRGITVGGQNRNPATIIRTTDGGSLWVVQPSLTSNLFYYGVSTHLTTKAMICGESASLIKTTDNGANWRVLFNGDARGQTMFNLALADTQSGYAVGPYGIVVKTTNGGTIWQRQNLGGTSLWFYGVDSPDPNYAWGCGDGGSIYATKNGGTSWASQPSGVSWFLNSVDMVDTLFGVSVGGGYGPNDGQGDKETRRGGETALQNEKLALQKSKLRQLDGWTVEDNDSRYWESPDLVDKWWWLREGETKPEAQYRVITRTLDGTNWQGRTTSETPLNGVSFANKAEGWACGVSGTMIHTSDSGATWQTQNSNVTNTLYWVIFPTATYGWAVGTGGTIIATTDGGNTWNRQTSNTTSPLYSSAFVNAQRGWVVGDSGIVLQTTNGGQTWTFDTTRTTIPLYAANFTDQDHGWSIGGFGLTLGYGRAGQYGVEQGSTGAGELRVKNGIRAWPNPFVSYARVPGHEKEKFALYDITGRRVGTYKGDRIGADATAGVYFLMAEGKEAGPIRIVKVR